MKRYKRPPKPEEWDGQGEGGGFFRARKLFPATSTVQRYFGTWNAALEAAGVPTNPSGGQPNGKMCGNGRHPWIPENIFMRGNGYPT
jgi:hypothetical protein